MLNVDKVDNFEISKTNITNQLGTKKNKARNGLQAKLPNVFDIHLRWSIEHQPSKFLKIDVTQQQLLFCYPNNKVTPRERAYDNNK